MVYFAMLFDFLCGKKLLAGAFSKVLNYTLPDYAGKFRGNEGFLVFNNEFDQLLKGLRKNVSVCQPLQNSRAVQNKSDCEVY